MIEDSNPSTAQALGVEWPQWKGGNGSQQLNMNTTGGDMQFDFAPLPGSNFSIPVQRGVDPLFSVVDADSWEGGRGERCEFWRSVANKIPI